MKMVRNYRELNSKTVPDMTDASSASYLVRITNCLQTILELEPQLEKLEHGNSLLDEFVVLKSFLEKIDKVDLNEADVERIELATANFLKELQTPLAMGSADEQKGRRLQ